MIDIKGFPLRSGRMHEASGPAAPSFAAVHAARLQGPVLWVRESWSGDVIVPHSVESFFDVSRLLVAQAKDQIEVLAVAEEALRDGSCPLVILHLSSPIDLTKGRRLQLAAQAGGTIALCLIREDGGSNAAETRWHCSPLPDPDHAAEDSTLQRWQLIKNKSGTLGIWHVRWSQSARHLTVVSQARE